MTRFIEKMRDARFVEQLEKTDRRRPRQLKFEARELMFIGVLLDTSASGLDASSRETGVHLHKIAQQSAELAQLIEQQVGFALLLDELAGKVEFSRTVLPGCANPPQLMCELLQVAAAIGEMPRSIQKHKRRPRVRPTIVALVNRLAEVYHLAGGVVVGHENKRDFADFLRLIAPFVPTCLRNHISDDRLPEWFARFSRDVRKELIVLQSQGQQSVSLH